MDTSLIGAPLTWLDRFQSGVFMITRKIPPIALCEPIECSGDCLALQDWISLNGKHPEWVTAMGVIDAAEALADTPVDGSNCLGRNKNGN